jgi:cytochrome c biogenesis protein ResB
MAGVRGPAPQNAEHRQARKSAPQLSGMMIAQASRDPWRAIWEIATSDHWIAILLLSVAVGFAIMAWLPQMPAADPIAYARWHSEMQARFGDTTETMQSLGLLSIAHSYGFRIVAALLTVSTALRSVESGDQLRRRRKVMEPVGEWRPLANVQMSDVMDALRRRRFRISNAAPFIQVDRWPWADLFPLLTHVGGLLLLAGLLVTHLWGWRVDDVIVQGGERVELPYAGAWVALDRDGHHTAHSPRIVTYVEEQLPGLEIRADDGAGHPLLLQQTADAGQVSQLTLPLTEDQYLAIPAAQLVIRLAAQPGETADVARRPVLVQVYRSPSGRLVTQTVVAPLTAEAPTELVVDGVTLALTHMPYARLTAVLNPGLWPTGIGLALLVVGLLGSIAWPVRRLWLREENERVQALGDPLPTLDGEGDA